MTRRPPGRRTRNISRSAVSRSTRLRKPNAIVMASTPPSASLSRVTSPRRNSTRGSRWRASSSIAGEKSIPITRPDGPTYGRSSWASFPVPSQSASAVSPGRSAARRAARRRQARSRSALNRRLRASYRAATWSNICRIRSARACCPTLTIMAALGRSPIATDRAVEYGDLMAELGRRVGIGLAARGDVREAAVWARRAEDLGIDSIWVHDSYFERDPITYLTAMGMETRRIGLGAGALNPYTRHPVVVAMTMSALDDLAPRRATLALGSGLPLRLSQMAIPYDDTVARVSESIDQIRRLWTGQPLKLNDKVPPLQPMFQPPHRIPIYIAAYRTPFLDLCGEKADGYLARPAESLPAFQKMRARVLESATAHGRSAGDIDFRGYLLCLFDSSRQEALNRAKREPFVIYMISVLSDISMKRAGFEPALRSQIANAWRAEDYHKAGALIPDELLDAFILCGTVKEVAARAAAYHGAGMDGPLLQPILQETAQIDAVLDAAVAYASESVTAATAPSLAANKGAGIGRRLAGAWEVVRPFSFTASVLPVSVGGAIALSQGRMHWPLFVAALLGALGLHIGTNVINEIYDVRHGIDSITSPRMSMAILKGRISERDAFVVAWSGFILALLMGIFLLLQRGWPIVLLGLIGFIGGYFYTAPPFQYKYRALGLPLVFILMGPLMVVGSYFAVTGAFDPNLLIVSLPVGLLVTAILHGNEWRDVAEDTRHGFTTFSAQVGREAAHWVYVMLVLGAYVAVGLAVMVGALPKLALLTLFSLPLMAWILRDAERGAEGHLRAIAMIDLMTARLHSAFGVLLLVGLVAGSAVR